MNRPHQDASHNASDVGWFTALRNCFEWQFLYISFSFIAAIYLFFLNPVLVETFAEKWVFGYLQLSQDIYSPQTNFYAESVLFPWLAFMLGANKNWLFFKIFSSFSTILILPTIAYFASRYFVGAWRSWVFLLLFVLTYRYLWRTYNLGYPDQITIIFLSVIALQRQYLAAFLFALLATMSHFTVALISVLGLMLLVIATPGLSKTVRWTFVKYVALGLLVGRLILAVWYLSFEYQLQSRLDWAVDFGLAGFIERYEQSPKGFWLTPGIPFLIVYSAIFAWMCCRRWFYFALVMVVCLALAYTALFMTIDGLRVFAVVISAPYIFILKIVVEQLFDTKAQRQQLAN